MKEPIALAQGSYFLVTGLWPLIHSASFQRVTGPKTDLWLVKTVGVVITAIGASLLVAGWQSDVTPALITLAVGSAAGLAGIDIYYAGRRVISPVYFGDALLELGLIAWWGMVLNR